MTRFNYERRVFDLLKKDCSAQAQGEYERAIRSLLGSYNTTIYENRFIVGGAVEVFTWALLRLVGVDCILYGSEATGGDILLPRNKQLSVKGNFTGKPSNIKLLNQMGTGDRKWQTATLFVIADVGIVFGTPDMVSPEHIRPTGDGLVLSKKGLESLIVDGNNVFPMEIAQKQPTETTAKSRRASMAVAREILRDLQAHGLLEAFSRNQA